MPKRLKVFDPIVWVIVLLILFLVIAIMVTALFKSGQTAVVVRDQSVHAQLPNKLAALPTADFNKEKVESRSNESKVAVDENNQLGDYILVSDSCGPYFTGECLRVRSGPGLDYPVVTTLRKGIVLKTAGSQIVDGQKWYKVVFDEWLRYPERVSSSWYVAADFVTQLPKQETLAQTTVEDESTVSQQQIVVDRSEQTLSAYAGGELFMEVPISTGIALSPTPMGTFTIFRKTPSRYMQGPLPYLAVSKYYDLPGVPWNLYFTQQGAVIHGAYWHDSFGQPYSSGCVNMDLLSAQKLYQWAKVGTTVKVQP